MITATHDRTQYRELVAQVAEKARAVLPQAVNGRIESAAKLVLLHDVTPQADGSILVGSSSDPMKTYRLEGATCTCQDFVHGQAPEGWCQHRIAAGIQKRVDAVLAAQAPQTPPTVLPVSEEPSATSGAPQGLGEAPASVNCHIQIAGRQVQLTLRDQDEARLLVRLEEVLQRYPLPQLPAQASSTGEGWCSKHGLQMTQTHKDGRSWYSHRTPDGQWCKGRG